MRFFEVRLAPCNIIGTSLDCSTDMCADSQSLSRPRVNRRIYGGLKVIVLLGLCNVARAMSVF